MKIIQLSILLFIGCVTNVFADQNHPYDWDASRKLIKVDAEFVDEPLLLLKTHIQYEYVYEDENLVQYYTEHRITKTGSAEAVEKSNRIYIRVSDGSEIVNLKARTLKANGKEVLFDLKNLKEIKDDESGGGYKIFAIEGAEVGGEIEYFYTKRQSAGYFIRRMYQGAEPSLDMSFRLICPENLEFDTKGYNGWPETKQIDEDETENIYESSLAALPRLRKEDFGSYTNNRARLESKLAYNSVAGTHRLFSWASAANRMDELFYPFEKEEQKLLDKELSGLKLKSQSVKQKIAAIEDHVKTNYFPEEQVPSNAEEIAFIFENKFSSKRGLVRLMAGLLRTANIEYHLVVTADRGGVAFDPDFDTWNYLEDYLLYFPGIDQYMSPYSPEFRLGLVPPELTATYGLFVSYQTVQGIEVPLAETKYIPSPKATVNHDNLNISISFSDDNLSNNVACDRSFKGYSARFFKAAINRMTSEQKKEMLESVMQSQAPDAVFSKCQVENTSFDYDQWHEPFLISSVFETESYIENAGDVILFKLGESIGVQSEMYQETERVGIVENDYNRSYDRTIVINLPKGYTAQNLEDINMDVSSKNDNDKVVYLFKSSYVQEGQKVTITIDEFYDQIYFPLKDFEEFRAVVNAAADWNKVTLVLEEE